jgi:hypothetical protein
VLVVDRDVGTRDDRRLVAHLGSDEPPENAALVCVEYLRDGAGGHCRCRPLTDEDLAREPFADAAEERAVALLAALERSTVEGAGCSFRLDLGSGACAIPELRWRRRSVVGGRAAVTVSLREAVGALQSYEPLCSLTAGALRACRGAAQVSTSVLRLELARVRESPIVLNRRLREVTLATLAQGEVSMSEIAIRCGRVKRDCRGNQSGETSWLARRLGLLAEGGQGSPTPWIHSDVLALIARAGLGLSPREVEL